MPARFLRITESGVVRVLRAFERAELPREIALRELRQLEDALLAGEEPRYVGRPDYHHECRVDFAVLDQQFVAFWELEQSRDDSRILHFLSVRVVRMPPRLQKNPPADSSQDRPAAPGA